MFTAHFFFTGNWIKTEGGTPEEALGKAEKIPFCYGKKFTYRPSDRTIYCDGYHIPCGIIIQKV